MQIGGRVSRLANPLSRKGGAGIRGAAVPLLVGRYAACGIKRPGRLYSKVFDRFTTAEVAMKAMRLGVYTYRVRDTGGETRTVKINARTGTVIDSIPAERMPQ